MGFVKQDFLDKLEKLQTEYAECKIDTATFEQELEKIGVTTEEIPFEVEAAEEARYEFKLDKARKE